MLTFSLLILCLNLDALSYGIANGAKNKKFSFAYVLLVCIMSTIMFAVPLMVSKYVFQYFDETICRTINAAVLIAMGIFYMIPKKSEKPDKNIKNNKINQNKLTENSIRAKTSTKNGTTSQPNYSQNNLTSKNKSKQKNTHFSFPKCFCECLVISIDAIFTAFLSGFSENYYLFSVAFYAITNFLAIIIGNRVLFKISGHTNFSLDFFSGLIFIVLGMLKIVGF